MQEYPYFYPIVLTDEIFVAYGGHTGSTVQAQRNAAYQIAEMFASEDLGTLLKPTTITGTFTPNIMHECILDYGWVNSISIVKFYDEKETMYWSQVGTDNYYVSIRGDGKLGIVDINYWVSHCNCCSAGTFPYKVQIVYNAGLQSGTTYQPNHLLGLTTYADIILNEIVGYGNEAPGDIGVKEYANQDYRESRVTLLRTTFGTSARAQFVSHMFSKLRQPKFVGMI
jgi:hypothetical protein